MDDSEEAVKDELEQNTSVDTIKQKLSKNNVSEKPVTKTGIREDILSDIVGQSPPKEHIVDDSAKEPSSIVPSTFDILKQIEASQATVDGLGNSDTGTVAKDDKSFICWGEGCKKQYGIKEGALKLTPKGMVMSFCPHCGRSRLLYRLDRAPPDVQKLFKTEEVVEAAKISQAEEKTTSLSPESVFKAAQTELSKFEEEDELPLTKSPDIDSIQEFLSSQRNRREQQLGKQNKIPDTEIDMTDDSLNFSEEELAAMEKIGTLKKHFIDAKKELQTFKKKDEVSSREEPGMPNRVKGILDQLGLKTMMDEMLAMQAMEAYGDMAKGFFGKFNKNSGGYQQQQKGGNGSMDIDEIAKLMIMKQMFRDEAPKQQQTQQNDSLMQFLMLQQFMGGKSDGTSSMLPVLLELIRKQQQPTPTNVQPAPDMTPVILEVVRSLKDNKSNPDEFIKMITALQALSPKETPQQPHDNTEQFVKMLTTLQAMNPKKEGSTTEDIIKLFVALKETQPPPPQLPPQKDGDDMLKLFIAMQTLNKPQPQPQQPTVTDLLNTVTKIVETTKPPPQQQGLDATSQLLFRLLEAEKSSNKNTEVPLLMQFFDKIQDKDAEIRKAHDQMLYGKLGELAEAASSRGGDFEDEFKKITINHIMNKLSDNDRGGGNAGGIAQELGNMLNGPFGKVLGRVAETALQNKQSNGSFYVPPEQVQGIQQDIMAQYQGQQGLPPPQQVDVGIPPEYAHLFQQQPQQPAGFQQQVNGDNGPRVVRVVGKDKQKIAGTDTTIIPGNAPHQDTEITRDGANGNASPSKGKFYHL